MPAQADRKVPRHYLLPTPPRLRLLASPRSVPLLMHKFAGPAPAGISLFIEKERRVLPCTMMIYFLFLPLIFHRAARFLLMRGPYFLICLYHASHNTASAGADDACCAAGAKEEYLIASR